MSSSGGIADRAPLYSLIIYYRANEGIDKEPSPRLPVASLSRADGGPGTPTFQLYYYTTFTLKKLLSTQKPLFHKGF